MTQFTRRSFLAGAATVAALPLAMPALGATAKPRVVIVGGGFGGASLARYLRRRSADIAITLIEKDKQFSTCPFSNGVLGGLYGMDHITFGYDKVQAAGIDVVHDLAMRIDPAKKTIATASGKSFGYDYLVLSPGIQFDWKAIQGYDEKAAEIMPHAYMAGPQTVLLRQQLEAMEDGGSVVISVPAMPFRCPPGPYERASMMAWYFKNHKPKSTITILDSSDSFIKQDLFMEAWARLYPGMIKWVSASNSGKVTSVDSKTMTVSTDFDDYKPAVANIIPPQKAGQIALSIGLDSGTGWCAIDPITFQSKVEKGIYLLGDATIAGEMPKSGFSANSQAMACGRALLAEIAGKAPVPGKLINVCYSTVEPDYAFEIVDDFTMTPDTISLTFPDDRTTPLKASDEVHKREADNAKSWYANITSEMFG
jgi:sulfide dehydrogenase [flavocytochrome c] flavoprotein subunit